MVLVKTGSGAFPVIFGEPALPPGVCVLFYTIAQKAPRLPVKLCRMPLPALSGEYGRGLTMQGMTF